MPRENTKNNLIPIQLQHQQKILHQTSDSNLLQKQRDFKYNSPSPLKQSNYQKNVPFHQIQQLDLDIDSDSGDYAEIRAKSIDQNELYKIDKKRECKFLFKLLYFF